METQKIADACDDLKRLLHSALETRENVMAENGKLRRELAEAKSDNKVKRS
jgi:hypothetical protein